MLDENDVNEYKKNQKIIYSYYGEDEDEDKYFEECAEIEESIFEKFEKYVYVKIFIDSNDEKFIEKYDEHIREHNRNLLSKHSFELLSPCEMLSIPEKYTPEDTIEDGEILYNNTRLDFDVKVQCHMIFSDDTVWRPISYMVHPIPTNTMNKVFRPVEYIEANYIGNLKVDLGCDNNTETKFLNKYDQIYQLMNVGLDPLYVERVGTLDELYTIKYRMTSCVCDIDN